MENNEENLAKFLAQYLGQEVKLPDGSLQTLSGVSKHKGISGESVWWFYFGDEKHHCLLIRYAYLLLTPLSAITDEDAIEVAKFVGLVNVTLHRDAGTILMIDERYSIIIGKDDIDMYYNGKTWLDDNTRIVDKLRSLGIAYEWMGLSVPELVNRNWIKLKQD